MSEARNNGVPLIEQAPRAAITQAIKALSESLNGDSEKEVGSVPQDDAKGGWLSFWPGKSKGKAKK